MADLALWLRACCGARPGRGVARRVGRAAVCRFGATPDFRHLFVRNVVEAVPRRRRPHVSVMVNEVLKPACEFDRKVSTWVNAENDFDFKNIIKYSTFDVAFEHAVGSSPAAARTPSHRGDVVTMIAYQNEAGTPREPLAPMARIDSWRINVPTQSALIDAILRDVDDRRGGTVFTINLDHLSKLRRDADFRAAYEHATYVTADGMPVVMLARAEGAAIDRVTGADLVMPLARAAAVARVPIYFFGTSEAVLARAIGRMRAEIPDLLVAGFEAPPMGFDPRGEDARAAARRIAASGAGICFVALGAPKQELFADTAVAAADGVVYLGIGAALDFIAGHRARAPRLFQVVGMEWLWRALQEPRRLIPRYADSALWLAGYVAKSLLGIERPAPRAAADVVPLQTARRD